MELKTGYKRTEAGIVPADWLDCTVGDLIKFEGGSQPDKSHFKQSWIPGYTRLIQIRDYKSNRYETYVPSKLVRRFCEESDIMIGRYGPPVFQILKGISGAYNVALIKAIPESQINKEYAYYFLKQDSLFTFIDKLSQRSSGQTGVDLKELKAYPLSLPPTQVEQEAIAEALSDADALIESLDQLITKKRQIKQGAMQELLTGKRRLPGFNAEWDLKSLGDLGSTYGGLTGKTKADFGEGSSRYITFMNVMANVVIDCDIFEPVNISSKESQNRASKGDLFFNGSSETPEEVGLCSVLTDSVADVYLNSFCFGFRFREGAKADGLYLAYYFRSLEGRELLKSLAQGATRYNLSKTALLKVTFPLPSLEEQTAIATVLSDMDTELVALESRLAKARQIKQGMMQELLTGRIRLL